MMYLTWAILGSSLLLASATFNKDFFDKKKEKFNNGIDGVVKSLQDIANKKAEILKGITTSAGQFGKEVADKKAELGNKLISFTENGSGESASISSGGSGSTVGYILQPVETTQPIKTTQPIPTSQPSVYYCLCDYTINSCTCPDQQSPSKHKTIQMQVATNNRSPSIVTETRVSTSNPGFTGSVQVNPSLPANNGYHQVQSSAPTSNQYVQTQKPSVSIKYPSQPSYQQGGVYVIPSNTQPPSLQGGVYVTPSNTQPPSQQGGIYVTPSNNQPSSQQGGVYVTPSNNQPSSQQGGVYVTPSYNQPSSQQGNVYVIPSKTQPTYQPSNNQGSYQLVYVPTGSSNVNSQPSSQLAYTPVTNNQAQPSGQVYATYQPVPMSNFNNQAQPAQQNNVYATFQPSPVEPNNINNPPRRVYEISYSPVAAKNPENSGQIFAAYQQPSQPGYVQVRANGPVAGDGQILSLQSPQYQQSQQYEVEQELKQPYLGINNPTSFGVGPLTVSTSR